MTTNRTSDDQAAALTALVAERDALQAQWARERLGAVQITQLTAFGPRIADTRMMRRKVELGQHIDQLEIAIATLSAGLARDRLGALTRGDEGAMLAAARDQAQAALSAAEAAHAAAQQAWLAAQDAVTRQGERVTVTQQEIARHEAARTRWQAELERDRASAEAVDRIDRQLAVARREHVA